MGADLPVDCGELTFEDSVVPPHHFVPGDRQIRIQLPSSRQTNDIGGLCEALALFPHGNAGGQRAFIRREQSPPF